MTLDPALLSSLLLGLTAWGAAFVAALWLSLIVWTYRDITARGKDPLLRFLAVLVVAVLFLPGIVVYLILRPRETLEEEYQHTLEEEALLRSIEAARTCPGCGRHTKDEWLVCPHCYTKQKKPCHHCAYLMDLAWNICPHCGTPAPGLRREGMTVDEALQPLALNLLPDEELQEDITSGPPRDSSSGLSSGFTSGAQSDVPGDVQNDVPELIFDEPSE